jgi:hypothetical protein
VWNHGWGTLAPDFCQKSTARWRHSTRRSGVLMRKLITCCMATMLAGCAGSIVGDALIGPEGLAKRDDAYCQSIGAAPGTPEYVRCRQVEAMRREAHHDRMLGVAATGLAIASQPPPPAAPTPPPVPDSMTCTANPTYGGMHAPSMTCR